MSPTDLSSFSFILRKGLLAFSLIGTLAIVLYGSYSWYREERDARENLLILSSFLASASQSFLDDLGNGLAPLGDTLLQLDSAEKINAVLPLLLKFQRRHAQVRAIAVFTSSGKMLINTAAKSGEDLPDIRRDPPFIKQILIDMQSSAPYTLGPPEFGKVLKRWRFTVRHVVRDRFGTPKYLIQVAIPLEQEGTFLHQLPVPPNSYIGLLRADGFQQARFPVEDAALVYGRISLGPVARKIKHQPKAKSGYINGVSPWAKGDLNRIAAFTKLPTLDMYAYVSTPSTYLIQRWWQRNAPIMLSFTLFFGLFTFIAYRVSKHGWLHRRELFDQANRDALTGLPNRSKLNATLEQAIRGSAESHTRFSILFLDLDRFKSINDTFGHAIGDALLIKVSQTIQQLLDKNQIIGRFGGDEFLLVLPSTEETGGSCVSQKILDAFTAPFDIAGNSLRISTSIGIAHYPEHGHDLETLIKHADTAMYESKRLGRNAYTVYTDQLGHQVRQQLELENQLRDALDNHAFCLHYQPIVDLQSGRIVTLEALLRWVRPNGELVMPGEFIHVAEDSGIIIPLGLWVLRNACMQLKQWLLAGLDLKMAVNLSTRQFQDPDLLNQVMAILHETNIEPWRLELEITESAAMLDPEHSLNILNALTANGVRVAIDDFGTGYSSLSYLKRIPANTIKIDKTFVDGVGCEQEDTTIVRSIVALAQALEKETVAEGIETQLQFEKIVAMGCTFGQGTWISLPLAPSKLYTLMLQSVQLVKPQ
jgi:diguanylate cyclase (GGDEF)-like protein